MTASKSWAQGSTRRWRKIRLFVLDRDGYVCQLKIPGTCTTRAEHAHHTKGRAATGDDPRYIVAACEACNLKVGDPTKNADPPVERITKW